MRRLFLTGLALVLGGSFLAAFIQTDNGNIQVRDVRFVGSAGQTMSALLYLPPNATASSPQPGVLAIHGYINSRETQSGFAIELARRGMVVLALDQTGHGYSAPPAFLQGFGGPDGLRYLRSLPFVDKNRVALEGHSMGGWASLMAASAYPDDYETMVLAGSSTGTLGTAEGTTSYPRNLFLLFSQFDEFSALMWESEVPGDIVSTEKLKRLFGTDQDVVVGQMYGNIADGSARKLVMPGVTHPGDHHSVDAIGEVATWLQTTLKSDTPLKQDDQVWYLKELGTLLALLGLFVLVFPISKYLLTLRAFQDLNSAMPRANGIEGKGWYVAAVLTSLIPIATFFPLQTMGPLLVPPNAVWAQSITTGIVVWMVANGVITMLLFGLWIRFGQRRISHSAEWGLGGFDEAGQSFLMALLVVSALYILALGVHFFFLTDFRIWVVALKLMSRAQFFQAVFYAPFFCLFFIVLGISLHTQLRIRSASTISAMTTNSILLSLGFVILLGVQYIPLFLGGSLAISSQQLLTIVAFQFVPLMVLIACISTWCFYQTGSVYPGGFINGLLITWYVVAGQATQAVPFFS